MATTCRVGELPPNQLPSIHKQHWVHQALSKRLCCGGIGQPGSGISLGFGQIFKAQKGRILQGPGTLEEQANAGRTKLRLEGWPHSCTTRRVGGQPPCRVSAEGISQRGRRETRLSAANAFDWQASDEPITGGTPKNLPDGRPHEGSTLKEGLSGEIPDSRGEHSHANSISSVEYSQRRTSGARPPLKKPVAAKDAASLPELDELQQLFDLGSCQGDQRAGGNLETVEEPRLSLELLEELLSGKSSERIGATGSEERHAEASAAGLAGVNAGLSRAESALKNNAESRGSESEDSSSDGWSLSALETALRSVSDSDSDSSKSDSAAFEALIDPGAAGLFVEDGRTERLPIEDVLGEAASARRAVWRAEAAGLPDRRETQSGHGRSWQTERLVGKEGKGVPGLWSEWLESVKKPESSSETERGDLDSLRSLFDAENADNYGQSNRSEEVAQSRDEDNSGSRRRDSWKSNADESPSERRGLEYEKLSPNELFGAEPFEVLARKAGTGGSRLGEEDTFQIEDERQEWGGLSSPGSAVKALREAAKRDQNGGQGGSLSEKAGAPANDRRRSQSARAGVDENGDGLLQPNRRERLGDLSGAYLRRSRGESNEEYEYNDSTEWGPEKVRRENVVAGSLGNVDPSPVVVKGGIPRERGVRRDISEGGRHPAGVRSPFREPQLKSWRAPVSDEDMGPTGYAQESGSRLTSQQGARRRGKVSKLQYTPLHGRGSSKEEKDDSAQRDDRERAWVAWQNSSGERSPEEMERFFSRWMQDNAAKGSEQAERVSQGRFEEKGSNQGGLVSKAHELGRIRSCFEGPNERTAGDRRDTSSSAAQLLVEKGVNRQERGGVNELGSDGVNGPKRGGVNESQWRERVADVSMMPRAALLSGWGIDEGANLDWIGDEDQPEADTWQQEDEDDEEDFVQPNESEITQAFDPARSRRQEPEDDETAEEEAPKSLDLSRLEGLSEEQRKAHLLAQTLDLSLQNRQNLLKASRPKKKPREETSMDERGFARFGEILPELERQKLLCQKVKAGKLVWAPCCVYYIIHHSHTEILRFFNARTRALARQWKLGYLATRALNYYMRSSCALTLAMKHELKSRAAAYRKWGRELTDPITRAKFDMRTPIPKGGWDSIDWDRPVGVRAVGGGYYTPDEMRIRSRMVPQPITWQIPTKEDPTMGGRWDLGIDTPERVKDRPRPQPRKQGRRR